MEELVDYALVGGGLQNGLVALALAARQPERRVVLIERGDNHVLARFYRLPEGSIRRFYAMQLTTLDRARMFAGAPPRGLSWRAALGLEAR